MVGLVEDDDQPPAGSARPATPNLYLSMAGQIREMARSAHSSEIRVELGKLAAQYEKLAERAAGSCYAAADAPPLEPYRGTRLMPLQETYFHYNRDSVMAHAPHGAGIYALWNKEVWIYIGACNDLQERLVLHLVHDVEGLHHQRPTAFGFELIDDPAERTARQTALIRDLMQIY